MTDAHTLWKTAHIISSTVVFGTALGIAFFVLFGYRLALKKADIGGLRSSLWLAVIGDAFLTGPMMIFQVVSGLVLLNYAAWSLWSPLVLTVLGLFVLVALLWLPAFVIQILLSLEAQRTASVADLSSRFRRRFVLWFVLGAPGFPILIGIFYLMVAKPLSINAI